MNFRNHARECLIKNCKKAQIVIVICLFQSFRKMSPISYVKGYTRNILDRNVSILIFKRLKKKAHATY